jgi:hypothetical protein
LLLRYNFLVSSNRDSENLLQTYTKKPIEIGGEENIDAGVKKYTDFTLCIYEEKLDSGVKTNKNESLVFV